MGGNSRGQHFNRSSAITYNTKDHLSILFRLHGSVWRHVFRVCVLNCIITFVIIFLQEQGIDLTFKDSGHKLMSVLVSFLVVSRNSIVYGRYMEARSYLGALFRTSRELVQSTAALTQNDHSEGVVRWRTEVARQTIILLEVTLAFLSYRTKGATAWDSTVGITTQEKNNLKKQMRLRASIMEQCTSEIMKEEMTAETPILLIYNLRKLIANYKQYDFEFDVPCLKEMKLYTYIDAYAQSLYGLRRLVTTPFPFPLVQMARTFLAFWLFTMPFVLVNDMGEIRSVDLLIVFFLTYGYAGLELVSMEMDDPFGTDDNDFAHEEMAAAVFEDIYLIVYDVCGGMEASQLRRMFGDVTESYKVAERAGHHRKATEIDDSVLVGGGSMDSIPLPGASSYSPGSKKSRMSFFQTYSRSKDDDEEDESSGEGEDEEDGSIDEDTHYEDAFSEDV